jgi:hypothetical protein
VCSVDSQTLQPLACEDYDPRDWKECLWFKGFEGQGEESWGFCTLGSRGLAAPGSTQGCSTALSPASQQQGWHAPAQVAPTQT